MNSPLPLRRPPSSCTFYYRGSLPILQRVCPSPVFAVAYIPTALEALSSVGMTSWASLSEGEGGGISSQSRDAQGCSGG